MDQTAVPLPDIVNLFLDVEARHRVGSFEQLVNGTTNGFFGAVTVELLGSLIPVLDRAVGAARDDNGIEGQNQQPRLLGALLLSALALRNVSRNSGYTDDLALRRHRRKRQQGIKGAAVLAHAYGLELRHRLAAPDHFNQALPVGDELGRREKARRLSQH